MSANKEVPDVQRMQNASIRMVLIDASAILVMVEMVLLAVVSSLEFQIWCYYPRKLKYIQYRRVGYSSFNPFTPESALNQNSRQISNFIL